jgi:hypothetical protein
MLSELRRIFAENLFHEVSLQLSILLEILLLELLLRREVLVKGALDQRVQVFHHLEPLGALGVLRWN